MEKHRRSCCITWSRALRPWMSQVSPRAACRAWVTTQLMQPRGLWDTWAASVSVTSALQMASGSSSGSAKMKILGDQQGGEWGRCRFTSLTSGLAGAAHISLFPLWLLIFPFSTCLPAKGSSLPPKIGRDTGGICPPSAKF